MKQDQKIKIGKVDLLDDSYRDPKNQKLRITAFIDGDIYDELKKRADESGGKYQTLMNKILRDALFGDVEPIVITSSMNKAIAKLLHDASLKNGLSPREKRQDMRVDRGLMAHSRKKKPAAISTKKKV